MEHQDPESISWYKTDIRNFYDNINHELLLEALHSRIEDKELIALIKKALECPTTSLRSPRKSRECNHCGIPQGLPISNILAAIYAESIDVGISKIGLESLRYVDDILILTKKREKVKTFKAVGKMLRKVKLDLNKSKTSYELAIRPLTFLGYRIFYKDKHKGAIVSVRDSSVEKLLLNLKGMFKFFEHHNNQKIRKFPAIDESVLEEVFISDLNEKITGAISESKRYGWLFFFNEINDMTLLFKLDAIVQKFFLESSKFGHLKNKVKKFVKAYYSIKFDPDKKYIHNYDNIETYADKIKYIRYRADINPIEFDNSNTFGEEQIDAIYNLIRQKHLSYLDRDIGHLY